MLESQAGCPRSASASSTGEPSSASSCPRDHSASEASRLPSQSSNACPRSTQGETESSCSTTTINPRNMMPSIPNESANEVDLSKGRERSNIPKSGADENWVYPSPQQFYNALLRKNKEVVNDPEVMDAVVFAHNVTNEQTWLDIQEWEKMHYEQCKDISLLRFVGRSEDLTPKAWFSHFFLPRGKPFDRHDWYVDRCGKQIRYIIDYYDDPRAGNELELTLDTRPALDSFANLWDRIRFRFMNMSSSRN